MTKEEQLKWNKTPKPKKPKKTFIKPKARRAKKGDFECEEYLEFLATKPCVVTGRRAERGRGANNIHLHHIEGRKFGKNDYLTVPLMGYVHSWGAYAYHSMAKSDFMAHYNLSIEPKEFFKWLASIYLHEWTLKGNEVPKEAIKELNICHNCKWFENGVCVNGDSDSCTEFVDMFDDCKEFER
jgi:hypothetical protein